ncbi:toll/interleukin-1 receptor domain-containing protein [Bradyrhizobium sp. 138]|uniref:toll/interleukin-1 receptor domain-containing protein n=1 Tax=Bradyrhizobium sp. 138 TaxID=2782615 RepID=UPI001FFB7101|nr:TIR domain-containing protein [Bradyrhizobium sp. 138]MCK1739166.1 toll/interleukin-1 receptor domain-containing protein [Bradyrhizobium sp. 138]
MDFKNDVFISFSHIDNERISDRFDGWITRFHKVLARFLSKHLGADAKIWRDTRLADGHVLQDEIITQLQQSAVMLSVISPRYLKSEWCTREMHEFCEHARRSGGLAVGSTQRLVPIVKTPVDGPLPPIMKDVWVRDFFTLEDGVPIEFDEAYGEKYGQDFLKQVIQLAFRLKETLNALRGNGLPVSQKPVVYLAECSHDRKRDREMIGGELLRLGYTVLPDRRLPPDEDECIAVVDEMLSRCALSVHLVGAGYGAVPDGPSGKSVTIHQNERAVARARSGGLKRLISLPATTHPEQPAQQAFVKALREDAEVQYGADLIAGDVEELKASIRATLEAIERPAPVRVSQVEAEVAEQDNGLIYLICDQKDRERKIANPLRKVCRQLGFRVETPVFEGDAASVRKAHRDLLGACDAIILFYGAGDPAWKRAMESELRKVGGYRRGKALPARYTCVAGESTPDKQEIVETEDDGLIVALEGVTDAALANSVKNAFKNRGVPL